MKAYQIIAGSLLVIAIGQAAFAQAQNPPKTAGASPFAGTTVQLPTFNFFGVSTTVSVPDRGSALLGGVNRSTTARNSAGLPLLPGGNTGISKSQSAGSVRISAWIHDLEAMDRFLLEQAAERRAPGVDPAVQQVVDARRATERSAAQSLEAIRLANQAEDDAAQRQLAGQLAKARELEEAGKPGVARIYYRMALKRATGPLRSAIATRLAEIDGARVVSGSE